MATARTTVLDDIVEQQNNPKNRITKMFGAPKQQEGGNLIAVAQNFYPGLKEDDAISSLDTLEFNFVFKM